MSGPNRLTGERPAPLPPLPEAPLTVSVILDRRPGSDVGTFLVERRAAVAVHLVESTAAQEAALRATPEERFGAELFRRATPRNMLWLKHFASPEDIKDFPWMKSRLYSYDPREGAINRFVVYALASGGEGNREIEATFTPQSLLARKIHQTLALKETPEGRTWGTWRIREYRVEVYLRLVNQGVSLEEGYRSITLPELVIPPIRAETNAVFVPTFSNTRLGRLAEGLLTRLWGPHITYADDAAWHEEQRVNALNPLKFSF